MASDLVQSLDRALSILDVLRLAHGDLGLGEIAARVGLPKSTTHRLLATLERRGMVEHDRATGSYRLAGRSVQPVGAGPEVRRILVDLAVECGETTNLGALVGSEVLYVDRGESPQALRWQLGVGSRVPAHCSGLGKAILAFLPPDEVRRRLGPRLRRYTAATITDHARLAEELAAVRRRGYALDNEEFMDGVRCVAVPLPSATGAVLHSLSLAGPAFRLTRALAERRVPALREAASRIAALLEDGAAGRPAGG